MTQLNGVQVALVVAYTCLYAVTHLIVFSNAWMKRKSKSKSKL